MAKITTLYYIHDPMCSWCWGFKPILSSLIEKLSNTLEIKFILGGLAEDSDVTMPPELQSQIRSNWLRIQETIPGTEFNFDFWHKNTPRRSTYPACRAVIAARKQITDTNDIEKSMINSIQKAYYLQARNPSDYNVLYDLAEQLTLDLNKFKADIHSSSTQDELMQEINFSRSIGTSSLPSLYLDKASKIYPIVLDYNNVDIIFEHIKTYL